MSPSTLRKDGELPRCDFVLCGMSVQEAAEVILSQRHPTPATIAIRPTCHLSYVRSVQDLAVAVVLGNQLRTGASLPIVGNSYPGRFLMERTVLREIYQPLASTNQRLDDLLKIPNFKDDVIDGLSRFHIAFENHSHVFRDWLVREAAAEFARFGRDLSPANGDDCRDYWVDQAIEAEIPPNLIASLTDFLADSAMLPADSMLKLFIKRNIVNIVAICKMYDEAAKEPGRIRKPNVVRSHLLRERTSSETSVGANLMGAIGRAVLNEALIELGLGPPEDLPAVFIQMRVRHPWPKLAQVLGELSYANDEELSSAVEAVVRCGVPPSELDDDALITRNLVLLELLKDSYRDGDYEERLRRTFSDLFPSPSSGFGERPVSRVVKEITFVMGDQINAGSGNTIINRSSVQGAFNRVQESFGTATAQVLVQIEKAINNAGNAEAAENFESFSQELQKQEPKKSLLKSLWRGTLEALPAVEHLPGAIDAIHKLLGS